MRPFACRGHLGRMRACGSADGECSCGTTGSDQIPSAISPDFLHQLVAVRKLLDITGLPLVKLLSFWADISTVGDKSLYAVVPDPQPARHRQGFPGRRQRQLPDAAREDHRSPPGLDGGPEAEGGRRGTLISSALAGRLAHAGECLRALSPQPTRQAPASGPIATRGLRPVRRSVRMPTCPGASSTVGEDGGRRIRLPPTRLSIQDHDDPMRPLAPSKKTILQLTKTLYDGLNAIDQRSPRRHDRGPGDVRPCEREGGAAVRPQVVGQIIGLLEGTTVYTTNAPANLTITPAFSDHAERNLGAEAQVRNPRRVPPSAAIAVTGILTHGNRPARRPSR